MKLNNSSILTMEDRAINGDPRISLLHAYADEWNLQIDDIGWMINTGMYKMLILDVKGKEKCTKKQAGDFFCSLPPKIIDESTTEPYPSSIRSGSNFTIKCYAHMVNQCQKFAFFHMINQTMLKCFRSSD